MATDDESMDFEKTPSISISILQQLADECLPASLISTKQKPFREPSAKPDNETTCSLRANNNPCHLFNLPLELREQIYGWVQGGPHIKIAVPYSSSSPSTFAGNVLLHVNKQVFEEYTNLIHSTSNIVLDFMSHALTEREITILRTSRRLTIRDMIPPVCGPKGYNRKGGNVKIPKHPGKDLEPWVNELALNPALAHLTIVVAQSVLFRCRKHERKEGKCDHVRMFRKATRQLGKIRASGEVKVLWDVHGWVGEKECAEAEGEWIRKLEERMKERR